MDLYFAGQNTDPRVYDFILDHGGHILATQWNERKKIERCLNYKRTHETAKNSKIFIDSSAYSAWTKKKQIDIDEYIEYLNSISDDVTLYAALDVIPGEIDRSPTPEEVRDSSEKSWENFLYMRKRVKHPLKLLYTYHVGEPIEYLIKCITYKDEFGDIPYMALGGLVGKTTDQVLPFLTECFDTIKKYGSNIKTHAFGFTRMNLLEQFPISSCDSTSYVMNSGMGNIRIGNSTILMSNQKLNDPSNYVNLPIAVQESIRKKVEEKGYTIEELQSHYTRRSEFNILNYMELIAKYTLKPVIQKKQELW